MRDVHEGDTLPKGTVIARLDPDDYGESAARPPSDWRRPAPG